MKRTFFDSRTSKIELKHIYVTVVLFCGVAEGNHRNWNWIL